MKTKKLVTSAMLIAIGAAINWICSLIPFLQLPFGGTITLGSMVPIIVISYMYGCKWGLLSGFVFSIVQMATGYATISALFMPQTDTYMGYLAIFIILLDYIFAFSSLGFAGLFRNMKSKLASLVLGTLVGLLLCYIFHVISGAIFYGAWAEWFFTDTIIKDTAFASFIMKHFTGGALATVYSACYNGCYMFPEIIISILIVIPLSRIIPKNNIQK